MLENIIFALIAGLTEFLPISSSAHQVLLLKFFGHTERSALLTLVIHLGALAAMMSASMAQLTRMRREQRLWAIPKRRRKRQPDMRVIMDVRLLWTAAPLVILSTAFSGVAWQWGNALSNICIMWIINGLVLYLPLRVSSGNKDSRHLSRLDGWLMGLCGALSVIPGLSRVGAVSSVSVARGADRQHAWNFALLLSLPALIGMIAFDVYDLIVYGIGTVTAMAVIGMILAAFAAYIGAYLGITMMKNLAFSAGFSGFSYYCWGAALFTLILHLTIF